MKIRVHDASWSAIASATVDELEWLDQISTHEYDTPDGPVRRSVCSIATYTIPTGFIPVARALARRDDVKIEVEDMREIPTSIPGVEATWLRPYQQDVIKTLVRRHGRGTVKAPTGAGKGEICLALTHIYNVEWLYLCHRSSLVGAFAERYRGRLGDTAGTVTADGWKRGTGNFTVATFQGMHRHLALGTPTWRDLLANVGGIIIDEVHAQPADTFFRVTQAFKRAHLRVGLSATPTARGEWETLRLFASVGPIVADVPLATLAAAGQLTMPSCHFVACRQDLDVTASWMEVYRDGVVKSAARNALLADMAALAPKPAFLFCDQEGHGRAVLAEVQKRGMRAKFVFGDWSVKKREQALKQLVQDGIDVVVCTTVFQEGVDVPELAAVVNGSGKKAAVAVLQKLGRGMRTHADKSGFEWWDVMDYGHALLEKHAHERVSVLEAEGHAVEVRECL
jgi:superfamily II DNA or RNA helicase